MLNYMSNASNGSSGNLLSDRTLGSPGMAGAPALMLGGVGTMGVPSFSTINYYYTLPESCTTKGLDVKLVRHVDRTTIVEWTDGTKTVVRCGEGEAFDKYAGFCAAVTKKIFGSTSAAKKLRIKNDTDLIKAEEEKRRIAVKKSEEEKKTKRADNKLKRMARRVAFEERAFSYAAKNGWLDD